MATIWSVTSSQVGIFNVRCLPKSCGVGSPLVGLRLEVTDCSIRRQPVARLVCDFQSSRVFQHPLPPKKLRRGKPARRLAARSHRLFNPASAGGQAGLRLPDESCMLLIRYPPKKTALRAGARATSQAV